MLSERKRDPALTVEMVRTVHLSRTSGKLFEWAIHIEKELLVEWF